MTPASRLILVKHSLPEIVEDVPAREWNLSEEGCRRVSLLVEKLKKYQPQVVVSSVEPKAQQTAEIISRDLGLDFHVVNGLHEHDRSKSPFHMQEDFQSLVEKFFDEPDILVFGSETGDQALSRFQHGIESVLHSHNDKNVLIVAHGTVISLYVSQLTGTDGYALWKKLGLPSFVVLDVESKVMLEIENLP